MKQVIAMHGWSGDSNSWHKWSNQFKTNKWVWESAERGYGEIPSFTPQWNKESLDDINSRRVVIAHSLGLHLINCEVLAKATDLVLLGSFSRFIPSGRESRHVKLALQGMQNCFGTIREKKMFQTFLAKACYPEPISAIPSGPLTRGLSVEGRKKLKGDFEILIRTNQLPKGLMAQSRVLVVYGQEDSIVAHDTRDCLIEDLKNHLDNPPTNWVIPRSGHLLLTAKLISKVQNWLGS